MTLADVAVVLAVGAGMFVVGIFVGEPRGRRDGFRDGYSQGVDFGNRVPRRIPENIVGTERRQAHFEAYVRQLVWFLDRLAGVRDPVTNEIRISAEAWDDWVEPDVVGPVRELAQRRFRE